MGGRRGTGALGSGELPCGGPAFAACCYDVVLISSMEAKVLEAAIARLLTTKQRLIRERMDSWMARAAAAEIDPHDAQPDLRAYHRGHLPCPLLDPSSHACMVYEARPLTCRGHFLVNQKPRACAERARRPIVTTLQTGELLVRARALLLVVGAWHKTADDPVFELGLLATVLRSVWLDGAPPIAPAGPDSDAAATGIAGVA